MSIGPIAGLGGGLTVESVLPCICYVINPINGPPPACCTDGGNGGGGSCSGNGNGNGGGNGNGNGGGTPYGSDVDGPIFCTLLEYGVGLNSGPAISVDIRNGATVRPLYNPGPLIQGDMLQTSGVKVAIVFKSYTDGKVTAAIRCNSGAGIAAELASHFNGGGHPYASGFKVTDGRTFDEIKAECLEKAAELLKEAAE